MMRSVRTPCLGGLERKACREASLPTLSMHTTEETLPSSVGCCGALVLHDIPCISANVQVSWYHY